jgi:hypothetical protein
VVDVSWHPEFAGLKPGSSTLARPEFMNNAGSGAGQWFRDPWLWKAGIRACDFGIVGRA